MLLLYEYRYSYEAGQPEMSADTPIMLRVGGVVPPPARPIELRDRHSTGIGHASRLVLHPAERSNPHLPATVAAPRVGFPLLVTPAPGAPQEGGRLEAWACAAREVIEAELRTHGAILFRGLPIHTAEDCSAFRAALGYPVMSGSSGVNERPEYAENVFGASEGTPHTHTLHLHNEQAYLAPDASPSYPRKIFFFSLRPADDGGQTPLLLNRDFERALGELPSRFAASGGVRYNHHLSDLRAVERQEAAGADVLAGVDLSDVETKRLSGGDTRNNPSTSLSLGDGSGGGANGKEGDEENLLQMHGMSETDIHSLLASLRAQPPSATRDAAIDEAVRRAWAERRANTWQARLGASSRAEAEAACRAQGMGVEWSEDGSLTMFTQTSAFVEVGEGQPPVWFSQ